MTGCAGQGGITIPGSIGATPIEAPVDIEEGLPVEVPLVYFYGHTTPSEHPELYKALVDRLADLLDRRARASPEVAALLHASKKDVELKAVKMNSTAQVGGAF